MKEKPQDGLQHCKLYPCELLFVENTEKMAFRQLAGLGKRVLLWKMEQGSVYMMIEDVLNFSVNLMSGKLPHTTESLAIYTLFSPCIQQMILLLFQSNLTPQADLCSPSYLPHILDVLSALCLCPSIDCLFTALLLADSSDDSGIPRNPFLSSHI